MPDEPEQSHLGADRGHLSAIVQCAAASGRCFRAGLAVAIVLAAQLIAGTASAGDDEPGQFDYYALTLSWSPTYCTSPAGQNDDQQCALGRRFAFVVHGLWPQYEQGWPQDCPTRERWVPDAQIEAMLDIMPSRKLVIHEWKKHGTCSGLAMRDYFNLTRSLFAQIKIPARYLSPNATIMVSPDQLVQDFVKTNRDLTPSMMSLQCGNRRGQARLSELRICFDPDGTLGSCGRNERKQCQAQALIMPPVR